MVARRGQFGVPGFDDDDDDEWNDEFEE